MPPPVLRTSSPAAQGRKTVAQTSASPSPLWGGIEGGGARRPPGRDFLPVMPLPRRSRCVAPPPLTPPHKGEGGARVALPWRRKSLLVARTDWALVSAPKRRIRAEAADDMASPGSRRERVRRAGGPPRLGRPRKSRPRLSAAARHACGAVGGSGGPGRRAVAHLCGGRRHLAFGDHARRRRPAIRDDARRLRGQALLRA